MNLCDVVIGSSVDVLAITERIMEYGMKSQYTWNETQNNEMKHKL